MFFNILMSREGGLEAGGSRAPESPTPRDADSQTPGLPESQSPRRRRRRKSRSSKSSSGNTSGSDGSRCRRKRDGEREGGSEESSVSDDVAESKAGCTTAGLEGMGRR